LFLSLQNVFSKLLLCSDSFYRFTPLEVQFFTSLGSVIAMLPICYFTVEFTDQNYEISSLLLYLLNGISFNCQSLLAFTLMSYISPVTYR
jgi:solute carrier family 35 protein E2